MANALQRRGVHGLVRQLPIELPGYGTARFDLAVPRLKWAIEIDAHPTHEESLGRLRDRRRDAAATAEGWLTSRIDRDTYEFGLAARLDELLAQYLSMSAVADQSA